MQAIQHNVSLQPYNTFGIDVWISHFATIETNTDLVELAQSDLWMLPKLILGGGSNILLVEDLDALGILMNNKGITVVSENNEVVTVEVQAGENWHEFVLYAIDNGWGGIENLSLIPGRVGASPMQNIGAYGVEIEQVFHSLTAFHIPTKTFHYFEKEDCEFGYRSSIFKTKEKGNYIITAVTFQLQKHPSLTISYGAISSTLQAQQIENPTIKDVSNAVIAIRQSKLPDPNELGNSGSFFKNPIVPTTLFNQLLAEYPNMPHYAANELQTKIPAGWLIEQCGFKGKQVGHTGTYKHQALILVNYGHATGEEIKTFAKEIQATVNKKFGIQLEPEVNFITTAQLR